jgi:hypothetical protein
MMNDDDTWVLDYDPHRKPFGVHSVRSLTHVSFLIQSNNLARLQNRPSNDYFEQQV